jgi:hypothetical protein
VNSTNELQYSGQIFTMEIAGKPTIAFEAANLTVARELYKEQWLKEDLGRLMANGPPLYTHGATLAVRRADNTEATIYRAQVQAGRASSDLTVAYLVEVTVSAGD